jgi:membrane fusion protein, copper/silver efflux system
MKLKLTAKSGFAGIAGAVIILGFVFRAGTLFNKPDHPSAESVQNGAETQKQDTIWTCSMHPQIRMHGPGKCPICFMDLIPLTSEEHPQEEAGATRLTMSEHAKALAGIATAPAVRRGLTADIRLTGKVALDETRVEMITARVGGRIDHLFVDYTGVPVKKGDHLASMYSPELMSLQKELLVAARAATPATDTSSPAYTGMSRTFDAAKEKLRLLGFSEKDLTRILERGTIDDHMTIRAGQHGVVLKKLVAEGSYVQTGTPLFHIADLRTLWLMLDAYESDLMWLRLGQKVSFSVEAFPGMTFSGTISFIDPVVNPQTRTVAVRVIVDNKDGRLKPDMFVKAEVKTAVSTSGGIRNSALRGKWISPMHPQIVKDHPGTCDICGMPLVKAEELGYVTSGFEEVEPLVIPATAPLYTGRRSLVYVEVPGTEKPTYEARTVELGPRVGSYYIVRSGITEGEQVVINGSFKIDGELQIRAKPSMMDPATGDNTHDHSGHADGPPAMKMPSMEQVPDITQASVVKSFLSDLEQLDAVYFEVAGALTRDEFNKAKTKLVEFKKQVESISPPKGEQYSAWYSVKKSLLKDLGHARHAVALSDVRLLFNRVSRQIITLEKQYGHAADTDRYLAFCPMAFDSKGAYWLQTEKPISNPYFGTKMLRCGEIKETFDQHSRGKQ